MTLVKIKIIINLTINKLTFQGSELLSLTRSRALTRSECSALVCTLPLQDAKCRKRRQHTGKHKHGCSFIRLNNQWLLLLAMIHIM